jgi:hypothetical protein
MLVSSLRAVVMPFGDDDAQTRVVVPHIVGADEPNWLDRGVDGVHEAGQLRVGSRAVAEQCPGIQQRLVGERTVLRHRATLPPM